MLADRIKEARRARKYTQRDLAKLMHVKPATVSGWEMGRNEPSINTLKKISSVLNVSFDYLVELDPEISKKYSGDLDQILTSARSFDGKPMNKHDKEIIKGRIFC